MKLRTTLPFLLLLAATSLSACSSNGPAPANTPRPTLQATAPASPDNPTSTISPTGRPVEATPTTQAVAPLHLAQDTPTTEPADAPANIPTPTGTIVDAIAATAAPTDPATAPSPTAVQATSAGADVTALQALAVLKQKAVATYPDARFALLVDSRPGQEKSLLGTSLGDPNVNEPTPGGKSRNWTLIAVSPSKKGATAFSMDGTVVDLQGNVPSDLLERFSTAARSDLDLSKLDVATLKDSDAVLKEAGARGAGEQVGIALMAPDGLGIGPLPTPAAGGVPPQLTYELFSADPNKQLFIFFDALTGKIVLDSGS